MFRPSKSLIGMVHVGALPGTPDASEGIETLVERSVTDARVLRDAGFDAIIVENMHDTPYVHGRQGPEIVASMTRVTHAVREAVDLPLGIQVLSGGNAEAVAIAHACGGSFIRCENFAFSHVADEGLLPVAEAGPLLRYRRRIGASVSIFCDIRKKHASHAVTADLDLADVARGLAFFQADALPVTGVTTGAEASPSDLQAVRDASGLPVLVGSGVTPSNVGAYAGADALIVGSSIKAGGNWRAPVDPGR
ncbi:MAG: BtpA/SgcQ family protein, partial [Phycisphaerales bacterium]|nr:BtpA/SgcQ family protein [Phycisphaerales bacterium]